MRYQVKVIGSFKVKDYPVSIRDRLRREKFQPRSRGVYGYPLIAADEYFKITDISKEKIAQCEVAQISANRMYASPEMIQGILLECNYQVVTLRYLFSIGLCDLDKRSQLIELLSHGDFVHKHGSVAFTIATIDSCLGRQGSVHQFRIVLNNFILSNHVRISNSGLVQVGGDEPDYLLVRPMQKRVSN